MRGLAVALCLAPGTALACALPPSVVMTLPTGRYILAAVATVAATALIGAAANRLPPLRARVLAEYRQWLPEAVTSYLAFLTFGGLILVGFLGDRDPYHNLLTLLFWTGVWVALPLASVLAGNLWCWINPWTAVVRITRVMLGRHGGIGLTQLGHLPAVAGYLGFIWFETVSLAPDDPAVLARVALGYWLVIFVLAVLEGDGWLQQGEFLTVYFGFIARIAPFWREDAGGGRVRLIAGWPGAQVLRMAPLTPSAVIFLTLALAGLTFDGLHETFFWLALTGQNPLEFSGRSAVVGINTVGLLAVWAATAAAVLGAFALARRLAGQRGPFWAGIGPLMLAFLAIAAGYHAAHYLVTLLTAGQYTLVALNDPLFRGDTWLGLPAFYYVSFGFLADPATATLVWNIQFAVILGAHVLAVVLGLHLAARGGRVVLRAHLPMTALMVGYTVLGLWLLASPIGA